MDSIGRTMNICLILFTIFATGAHGQYLSNRDIILTPNHLKTYPGKVLYYRPREQAAPAEEHRNTTAGGSSTAVPWEEVLKETVFLALNDNKTSLQQQPSGSTDNALLLAERQQKAIYGAPYVGAVDLSAPRFGDIVELAHGRLEHEGEDSYVFVQLPGGNGEPTQRNVTALWRVERIRHRDELRGHRYELKFTVAPVKSRKEDDDAVTEDEKLLGNRTFIVRDEDYPKYFAPLGSASAANAILPLLRKNDQMYERTFFDLVHPQAHQQSHQFSSAFSPATRFYRPVVAPQQQQQTITLGQYLVQSLLSGGEAAPKYHHHQHHFMPGKLMSPAGGFFGGFAASTNRIKFPDSFTGSSHAVPKFYQHIHFQRPSIAPLAPTALPGSYLFHHSKEVQHAPAPSNIHQDYTKLVDLRGSSAPSAGDSVERKPTSHAAAASAPQKGQSAAPNQLQQTHTTATQKAQQKPQQFPSQQQSQQQPQQQQQQQQQQFQQVPTTPNGLGQQTPNPFAQQQQPPFPPQFPLQQHALYRPQLQHQQPILIHPHAHPQLSAAGGGPAQFIPPFVGPAQSHLIQSIPFYNPQGQMVLNHIPVMSNHHVFQMSPSQPIAIPVHVQLIPPVAPAAQLYAPQQQQQQGHSQQQQQQQQQQQPQQDGPIQAIPKALGGTGGSGAGTSTVSGGGTSAAAPTTPANQPGRSHRYNTPIVQLSGPSISPTPPSAAHQRHRFSTPGTGTGTRSSSVAASSPASPTSPATRASARYTPAVGQVSGPTVSSTAANHRYPAPLPTVPASPAGLREKFTAPAFQPAASESKQSARKLEPPAAVAQVADTVGSPSNAVSPKYESFGVENAVTPTSESLLLLHSPSSPTPSSSALAAVSSSLSQHHSSASVTATASTSSAARTTLADGGAFSYSNSNFIDTSGAVSVTAKLTSEQTSPSYHHHRGSTSSTTPRATAPPTSPPPVSVTTQATFMPPPKTYIQQLGPTIGGKYPPAFKSMPSVTILPPQIETPISSTLKTYQYLNHHDTYDFIPSRVVELAHVKKMASQKHLKRSKQNKASHKTPPPPHKAAGSVTGGMAPAGPAASHQHHHHVTVTSSKPLRFYPGDGPEYATHRPEAQLSVQLPPPEKDFPMTYYGTPKHNQKVQRPKNFVTPLHPYQGTSTTPLPATFTASPSSPSSTPAPVSAGSSTSTLSSWSPEFARNVTTSTFRSATASSTAHYYKNKHEKSDDVPITTMRPRMMLKTIYRQFPGSFVSSASSSTSTEKPLQKWVPKRPRTSSKSTSGEFSTSTLPSSSLPGSIEQAVASSERELVTKLPVVSVRPTHDQQMQRVRASRGRSRYTYRRIPSGNPPPIPTGQQQQQPTGRTSRMRVSNFNTSTTTTIKPIPAVTSSVFDSNRIDGRSFEQQERKAEETVMTAAPKNVGSNEKIKRDASDEAAVKQQEKEDHPVPEVTVAEQQVESKQNAPMEVIEPEKEYVMVKANIEPIATNRSNVVFFEASDAAIGSAAAAETGRSIGSTTIDDLTMSIINHAKAIVNQTERPVESVEDTTVAPSTGAQSEKAIESNEIAHKDEPAKGPTVEVTTTSAPGSTALSPVTESTIRDEIATEETTEKDVDASQTTVVAGDVA